MLRLASGSAGAQIVQFLATLALARLLAPSVFGDFAVFLGYGAILTTIAGLKLEQAIQLQTDDATGFAFARGALIIAFPVSFGASSLLSALAWTDFLPGSETWRVDWPIALGAYAWLGLLLSITSTWHVRRGNIRLAARLRWCAALGIASFQIAAASFDLGVNGQVWGAVLGIAAGWFAAHAVLLRDPTSPERLLARTTPPFNTRSCLYQWQSQSLNLVLAALAGNAAWQIPPVFLHEFLGAEAAGHYALAFRLSIAPLALSFSAISDIAYRETSLRLQNGHGLNDYMRRSTLLLFSVTALAATVIAVAAPLAVPPLFGARWSTLASLLPWMMLPFAFRITGSALSIFTQTARTRLLLGWQCAFLLAHAIGFAAAYHSGLGLLGITITAAIVQAAFYLLMMFANLALAATTERR